MSDIIELAETIANQIQDRFLDMGDIIYLYGIPRGGIPAVLAVKSFLPDEYKITDNLLEAHVIIDDIIDSGNTRNLHLAQNPMAVFYALIDKESNPDDTWWIFPWEASFESSVEDIFIRMKQAFNNVTEEKIDEIKNLLGYIE